MSVLGIVTEYNPFHNGHLYHLNESKKITNSDYCVSVMSGNFIQRGEPAMVNKWARAKMAIQAGVDLVIELPVVYSLQSAENFAYGSIKTLDSLGIVDNICFGSEVGDIDILNEISNILISESDDFKKLLKQNLDKGISFPASRQQSLKQLLKHENLDEILNSSNNILGIEYLKALKKINSKMKAFTINRTANAYNSNELCGSVSSATAIRREIIKNYDLNSIFEAVPLTTYNILNEEFHSGRGPIFSSNFDNVLLSIIRKAQLEDFHKIFDISEGLENRIKKASMQVSSINDLIDIVKTKRYAQTRIQRILFHMLIGIDKSIYIESSKHGGPQYIRVLGFNQKGQKLLNEAKKKATLPIITKVSNYYRHNNPLLNKMIQYDITATNLYTLAYTNNALKIGDLDYTHDLVIEK